MALTGMQIYKQLPKTNCKKCGFPTCMAFAMQVAAKQKAISDCPEISEEATTALSEESAPPIKLVTIGAGDAVFETGQETVMFRHEDKFHRKCGIAFKLESTLSDDEFRAGIEEINSRKYVRVGKEIKVELCAVELDGDGSAERARLAAGASAVPIILVGEDPAVMSEAAAAIKEKKPLIYRATAANIDDFIKIAADNELPLAISAGTAEELADFTVKAKDAGVAELLLSFKGDKVGDTVRFTTQVRRSALMSKFRPFGYPIISEFESDSDETETALIAVAVAKYSGIVIMKGRKAWQLMPNLTLVQDVFTDPQVPNTVDAKLYEIGTPDENSPVMYTTNFSLTYFSVAGEVERSKIPAYICVVETEGLGVLNSWAGDKITAEKVIQTLKDQKVADKVKHRKLIIPGLLPVFKAEIEDLSEWKEVIIGPETAREIPGFLNRVWDK
ncbi:MAG: acetyl-CoA decarbonylase/synthase complex subunit gamma [Spirochaetales bacterium]|nr:acetyl-CoA decarbonylase/synthase complex subunit gamma [Spirochaetales bacterium]